MKNLLFQYFVATLLIGLMVSLKVFSQDNDVKNYRMLYKFNTIKQSDNSRLLEVSFIARNKKDRKDKAPVYGAEIKFFNALEDEEVLLGSAKTSKEGIAKIVLPKDQEYLIANDGYIYLIAKFEGTDVLDAKHKKIGVKDLFLNLELIEIDSIKTVKASAFAIDSTGTKFPVDEVDINFYIDGMLSKMLLEEGTLSNGKYQFELEDEFPGNADRNLTVYAQIEDNDDYGNVNKNQTKEWGTFNKAEKSDKNTLWSEAAPIWMYVVLTILLLGVWINYIYTIINLFKIKKEGKNLEMTP